MHSINLDIQSKNFAAHRLHPAQIPRAGTTACGVQHVLPAYPPLHHLDRDAFIWGLIRHRSRHRAFQSIPDSCTSPKITQCYHLCTQSETYITYLHTHIPPLPYMLFGIVSVDAQGANSILGWFYIIFSCR